MSEQTITRTTTLADELGRAESGTSFVYLCLAHLVDALGLEHAVAVVERDGIAHVFNRGGLPLTVGWERQIALERVPGIHTVPERDRHSGELLDAHRLCTVALRLAQCRGDSLEGALRSIDGIVAVGRDENQASTTVQVLVDASRAPARVREAVRKTARAATQGPLVLEVIVHEPARLRST